MCGITGIVGPGASRQLVEAMLRSVAHRGPDGQGVFQDQDAFIAQTRLSIIDLITGDQPMSNEDRSIWIAFNGEIYNYKELRRKLELKGHSFHTASDTETLLHGYEECGTEFLQKLDGIFAFALWDTRRKRLLLARDHFGAKPLHYHFDGKTLRFGSEIKAILQDSAVERKVDFQALHYFLNLRYIPGERTLFQGIKRLPPAHYLLFENGELRIEKYYELKREVNRQQNGDYFMEGITHYLREAVRKQMVSDVPLGVYLSGGLDSSSIVALMSQVSNEQIKTFAMGFNEPTDELEDARVVADYFKTDHHEIRLDPEPLRYYPQVIWHAEEPKENILQGFLLSGFARQFVKVVQGGLGGDELFAGYINNQIIYPSEPFHRMTPSWLSNNVLDPLSRGVFGLQNATGRLNWDEYRRATQVLLSIGNPERYYLLLRNVWDYDRGAFMNVYGPAIDTNALELTHFAFDGFFTSHRGRALEQALWTEFHTKMVDDFLMNEDRTSMAHGLEVRVPFLDKDLVHFAMSIPVEWKVRHNQTKYIFRQAMEMFLPPRIIRKKKWGFSFNPYYQFQKDLKLVAEQTLTKRQVETRGWFNYTYIRRILDAPPHPRLRWHYYFIWLAVGLEIWAQMFLERDLAHPDFNLESYSSQFR